MIDKASRTGKSFPSNPLIKSISTAVRASRKAYGMTQTELAGLSGTGLRFVSELERGKPTVSLDKVLAVLAVLGLGVQLVEKNK